MGRVAQAIAGLLQRSLVTRVYHSGHFEWIAKTPQGVLEFWVVFVSLLLSTAFVGSNAVSVAVMLC